MARRLASRLACVSTTPFGSPVLPEVYCRKAMSSARARYRSGIGSASMSCGVTISARLGTRAASSAATLLACGTVTMKTAWALSRMRAWRLRWSSIWARRAGG
jgi:hypothetical protein